MEESRQEKTGPRQSQVRWWSRGWVVLAMAAMAMLGFVIGRFVMRQEAAQTADNRQGLGIIQQAPTQETPSNPPPPEVTPERTASAHAQAQQHRHKRQRTRYSKGVRQSTVTAQRPQERVPASPGPVDQQRELVRTSP